ncbi:hypothetical protein IFM61606_01816 [Aspergillus udagawae]|uniref:Rhodopsin domain-containing protein n=1 Tax=Aspergillus udagawae TaxID=91492 RepID=A0A8H3PH41_9EURO|nr:uncharacterized protein Aud_001496 [Aspergillus udagawae]GFF49312.1 hypothetical protein IFM51744_07050 [Aspergillus udagawae]GFF80091.1 hypothetical protein IFM53868_02769 [Aspergillus udagawae]GFG09609.1 hypothetical protein IFM5058_04505 [Aspergillus udagawae]GFG21963.1 hypothetical protein IFM61606_01816 [Aspergillus udagawae]GIC85663.1 hypothetical protein Aud_001496 [Aspergillus udagawae]
MGSSLPLVDRALAIFVVSVVMMGISVVAVVLRSFVRLYLVRAFGWDDALMVLALSLFVVLGTCCMVGSMSGVGHRMVEFSGPGAMDELKKSLLWWWLGQMLYIWSSTVAKISISMTLLRLAARRLHRIILWAIIALDIVIGVMFCLILLLDCHPVSYFWQRVDPHSSGTCQSGKVLLAIAYLYSTLTIFCDLTLGAMPALLVWGLQMNRKTKVALGGILGLGAVASVAVIIRFPFLHYYGDDDFLYSTYQIAIWSVMETGLGITAGSLATLRPLFRWCLDGNLSGRHRRSAKRGDRQYPLSSLPDDTPKKAPHNPSYWRPDLPDESSNVVVTTISSPMARSHLNDGHSSQEELSLPEDSWDRYQVNIHKTFQMTTASP